MSSRRSSLLALGATALLVTGTLTGCSAAVLSGHGTLGNAGTRSPSGSSSGSSSATPPTPTPSPVQFQNCTDDYRLGLLPYPAGTQQKISIECALVQVPLDYADPQGKQIGIFVTRVHDSDNTASRGTIVTNPGGPGDAASTFAVEISAKVTGTLLQHYDLVGFDPRGTGQSAPVRCLTDAQEDAYNAASPNVLTTSGFDQAESMAHTFAQACERNYGSGLAQLNTVQTARDMNQVRLALGGGQLNYLGFSYGTKLGAQYAHLFPRTIRTMVLDGAVDPLTNPITSDADQNEGFEQAFDQFAKWCIGHSPCKSLGDPREAVYNLRAAAQQSPIPSPDDSRKATSSIVLSAVLSALYSESSWPTLAQGLISARNGNAQILFQLVDQYNQRYQGHYTNLSDAFATISCNDETRGPTDAVIRSTAKQWSTKYPMFGLWSAPSLFTCQQWQPDRTVPPLPTAPDASQTIVVIGNIHDPATPYQGAKDLAKTLGKARLLTWDGEGHTSYLQGSSCVDGYVNAYLENVQLPPSGKTCPP